MAEGQPSQAQYSQSQSGDGPGLIANRYEVIEEVARGGMGVVYKARHLKLDKLVAIKILKEHILIDQESRKRFEIEAATGGTLQHPNLVAVFDSGFSDNKPFLVMEYVDGASLEQLQLNQQLIEEEFLDTFIQVCQALVYVHSKNIVHRDLKPSNVMIQMIGMERYVKLLDFGIAKLFTTDGASAQHLTATGEVFGTPLYMSPEQCSGKRVDTRSDIYSLGCIMYECIAGYPPLKGANAMQTIFMHATQEPEPLSYRTRSQFEIVSLVHRCLLKAPEKRWQTSDDILARLREISIQFDAERRAAPAAGKEELHTFSPQPGVQHATTDKNDATVAGESAINQNAGTDIPQTASATASESEADNQKLRLLTLQIERARLQALEEEERTKASRARARGLEQQTSRSDHFEDVSEHSNDETQFSHGDEKHPGRKVTGSGSESITRDFEGDLPRHRRVVLACIAICYALMLFVPHWYFSIAMKVIVVGTLPWLIAIYRGVPLGILSKDGEIPKFLWFSLLYDSVKRRPKPGLSAYICFFIFSLCAFSFVGYATIADLMHEQARQNSYKRDSHQM